MSTPTVPQTADGQLAAFHTGLLECRKPNFTQWQLYVFERSLPYPTNHMMRALRLRMETDLGLDTIDPLHFGNNPILTGEDMKRIEEEQRAARAAAEKQTARVQEVPELEKVD